MSELVPVDFDPFADALPLRPDGLIAGGNVDIYNRPWISNPDGSTSTTRSVGIGTDRGEVLVPGVDGTRSLTPAEAADQYQRTGQNFGTFRTPAQADSYGRWLHEQQAGQVRPMAQGPDGSWHAYQAPTAADAGHAALDATGIPLLEDAYGSAQRGEWLPAIGQAGVGAMQLGGMAMPALRMGGAVAREGINAMPGVLADNAGTLRLPGNSMLDRIRALEADRLAGERGYHAAGDPARSFSEIAATDRPIEPGADPIRLHHASPHEFPWFDSSKIGTGEGNQAFTRGLYLGERPTVQTYFDTFSTTAQGTPHKFMLGGKELDPWADHLSPADAKAQQAVWGMFGSYSPEQVADPTLVGYAAAKLQARLTDYDSMAARGAHIHSPEFHQRLVDEDKAQLAILRDPSFKIEPGKEGRAHWYETDLHAHPEHIADYDKPLSGQSAYVRDRLMQLMRPDELRHMEQWKPAAWTDHAPGTKYEDAIKVSTILQGWERDYGPAEAADRLRQAGIPATKYLDGLSRRGGITSENPTHNYTVYDDKRLDPVKIDDRPNVPSSWRLTPVDHEPEF